jgi:hypothetical protein
MPSSFMGFGTTFYGKRDFLRDGSYVTTEWFIAAGIPIFPNQSLRLKDQGHSQQSTFVREVYDYGLCAAVPMNFRQVASVYGFTLFLFTWLLASLWLFLSNCRLDDKWCTLTWMLSVLVPFLLPMCLRRHARGLPISPIFFIRRWCGYSHHEKLDSFLGALVVIVVFGGILLACVFWR